eukprot:42695-Pelagomonas_calceolata.AAC.2
MKGQSERGALAPVLPTACGFDLAHVMQIAREYALAHVLPTASDMGFSDVVSGIEKVSEQKSAVDEIKVRGESMQRQYRSVKGKWRQQPVSFCLVHMSVIGGRSEMAKVP